MLYRFKSRAAPDLVMLESPGRRILKVIGKYSDDRRGILQPAEMSAAIAALEAAIAEEAEEAKAAKNAATQTQQQDNDEAVSLRQRAAPFLEMLRRCEAADKEIVWGV